MAPQKKVKSETTTAPKTTVTRKRKSPVVVEEEAPVVETPVVEESRDTMDVDVVEEETGRNKTKVAFDFKTFEDRLQEVLTRKEENRLFLKNETLTLKNLMKDFKKLQNELKHTKFRRNRNKDGVQREPSGFASQKGIWLSPELCSFLGEDVGTKLPRTQVTGRLRDYIKKNSLEDPQDRRNILPDSKLETLLGDPTFRRNTIQEHKTRRELQGNPIKGEVTDMVHYFNLQIHLRRHFLEPVAARETVQIQQR
jgi:chromatin remodeling complex protein RSC6